MSDKSSLLELGIKLPDLIAGFAGGVVNAFVFNRAAPWAVIGSILVGGFTANYLGEPVARMIGMSLGASSFVVGLGGMALCQALVETMKSRVPLLFSNKGGSDGGL
jgi:hypothetical protein